MEKMRTFSSINDEIYLILRNFFLSHEPTVRNVCGDDIFDVGLDIFDQYKDAAIPEIKNIILRNLDLIIESINYSDTSSISPENIPEFEKK